MLQELFIRLYVNFVHHDLPRLPKLSLPGPLSRDLRSGLAIHDPRHSLPSRFRLWQGSVEMGPLYLYLPTSLPYTFLVSKWLGNGTGWLPVPLESQNTVHFVMPRIILFLRPFCRPAVPLPASACMSWVCWRWLSLLMVAIVDAGCVLCSPLLLSSARECNSSTFTFPPRLALSKRRLLIARSVVGRSEVHAFLYVRNPPDLMTPKI